MTELAVAFKEQPYGANFQEWIRRAASLVAEGRLMEAEQVWRRAVEDEPHNGFAWLQLATVLVQQSRFLDAIDAVDRVVGSAAPHGSVSLIVMSLGLRGASLIALERNVEAASVLKQAAGCIDSSGHNNHGPGGCGRCVVGDGYAVRWVGAT